MTRYIGIDLHTNSFTVCILDGEKEKIQTLALQQGGLEQFISQLQASDEVAVEATGNSAWFREQLLPHVARVAIIAPWQFEVIRRSTKKTDKHDARAIAFFLSKDMLPEARLKRKTQTELASAVATRDQLVKLRVSLLNKAHGLFNRHGIKIKKETITSKIGFERAVASHKWEPLEQVELEVIAAQLDAIRVSDLRLKKEITAVAKTLPGYENLVSIKGIGPLSAAIFLCTIGDIEEFAKSGNLAAYFGITPRVSQSNDSQRVGRITKRGNKIARTTLVQCTLIAKRYSPYLQKFYQHIKATRGAGKAIIATARKLLNTIFYTLKNNWVFEDFSNFTILTCNQS
ncbi:MAG: IS110 family transposase [Verrucomicrobia bacterium]|jgi:transposase|nr:IS110 family transposase [Verrucomicrobiota bacterium]